MLSGLNGATTRAYRAFLTMSLQRLGREAEALTTLDELRRVIEGDESAADDSRSLLIEASLLMGAMPAPEAGEDTP